MLILSQYHLDAKKVLIVLTDGQSSGSVDQPVQQLKGVGVIIYSIGVGSGISVSELATVASSPENEHVYLLDSFNKFSAAFAEKVSNSICDGSVWRPIPIYYFQFAVIHAGTTYYFLLTL